MGCCQGKRQTQYLIVQGNDDAATLAGVADFMAQRSVKDVVVMCGAGISTSAGIPDFRTPGTGLYDNLQRFDLPNPEAVFTLSYFRERPAAFYELAKEMWPGNFEPTPGHYFIRLLHDKGLLRRCFTQNIDSLERAAGLPEEKVVAAHGNFDTAHVIDAGDKSDVDIGRLKDAIDRGEEGWKKLRDEVGGLVKPKIVFFGEGLPERFFRLSADDLPRCDLLVVLGTSLVVQPFAGLVANANANAPRLLINREVAGTSPELPGGFNFIRNSACQRDSFFKGDIDTGCRAFAKALGWEDDLEALIDSKGAAKIKRAPWRASSSSA